MNFKLYNLLTVCLATSVLLALVQKASGAEVTDRMNKEKIQHLVCVKDTQHSLRCQVENSQDEAIAPNKSMPVPVQISTQQSSVAQINQYENINPIEVLLLLVGVGSISLGLFLFLYNKHCNDRAVVLRRDIEVLERLWMLSSYQSNEKL